MPEMIKPKIFKASVYFYNNVIPSLEREGEKSKI